MSLIFNDETTQALEKKKPVVALESTVISHGLPYPKNLETAKELEQIIRNNAVTPATIAILQGKFKVGLDESEITQLATQKNIRKISKRDLPIALAKKLDCATTVATTLFISRLAGIKVFATGGIGGVHRGFSADISADLPELAKTPMVVVCAGAKIVLDLPATREWLETNGVTILGWKCDELPGFYTNETGLSVDERVETAEEVAEIVKFRDKLNLPNAVLLTVPTPKETECSSDEIERILQNALELAEKQNIVGKEITPFLLKNMAQASNGKTLEANIALLKNNAQIASKVATALADI